MTTSIDTKRRKALTPGPFAGNATIQWLHPQAAKSDTHKRRQALTPGLFDGNATIEWLLTPGPFDGNAAIKWLHSQAATSARAAAPTSGDKRSGHSMATQRSNGCTHKRRQALTPGPFDGNATIEWLHPQAATSADTRAIRWQRNDRMAAPTSGDKRSGCTHRR
jgi:hypothetical protein